MNVKELYDNLQFMGEKVPANVVKIKARDLYNLLRYQKALTSTLIIDEAIETYKQQLNRARANRYHRMCKRIVCGEGEESIGIRNPEAVLYDAAETIGKMEVEIP
jgi:hypothetical protein